MSIIDEILVDSISVFSVNLWQIYIRNDTFMFFHIKLVDRLTEVVASKSLPSYKSNKICNLTNTFFEINFLSQMC